MLLTTGYTHDSRVQREAAALAEAGHRVTVVARHEADRPASYYDDSVRVVTVAEVGGFGLQSRLRSQTTPSTGHDAAAGPSRRASAGGRRLRARLADWMTPVARTIGWRKLMLGWRLQREAHSQAADVYHAHEVDALLPALVCKLRARTSRLVYDAHELETHRAGARAAQRRRAAFLERVCLPFTDRVVTVSDPIADHLARTLRITRPTVIRNLPALSGRCTTAPRPLPKRSADEIIVLYLGAIQEGRALANLVRALPALDERVAVVMLGPARRHADELRHLAVELAVADRLRIEDPVLPKQVTAMAAQADIGFCGVERRSLSYYWSLPNKLFEFLAAGLPVVAPDFPEIRRVVQNENVGVLCDPSESASIAAALATLLNDERLRDELSANSRHAMARWNWDAEKHRLEELYANLGPRP